eukprot:3693195-Pyramimonas_sp.AAC.1
MSDSTERRAGRQVRMCGKRAGAASATLDHFPFGFPEDLNPEDIFLHQVSPPRPIGGPTRGRAPIRGPDAPSGPIQRPQCSLRAQSEGPMRPQGPIRGPK